jgi:predicted lipoprotein with Yx(FWY)xxD motif
MSIQDTRTCAAVITMFAAVALLAACGTAGGADTSSDAAAVRTEDNSGIGTILVDKSGKTLYFADQEADGTIQCVDDCLQFWFPAESSEATAPPGVEGLDVLRRADDARQQLTFQGKPLYTFRLDRSAGDANGNDVEDDFGGTHFVWHAVTVDGAAPTSGDSGGGAGGGGY